MTDPILLHFAAGILNKAGKKRLCKCEFNAFLNAQVDYNVHLNAITEKPLFNGHWQYNETAVTFLVLQQSYITFSLFSLLRFVRNDAAFGLSSVLSLLLVCIWENRRFQQHSPAFTSNCAG